MPITNIQKYGETLALISDTGAKRLAYPTNNGETYLVSGTGGGDRPTTLQRFGDQLELVYSNGAKQTAFPTPSGTYTLGYITAPTTPRFIWPFPLRDVSSEFGPRRGRLHAGMDFAGGAASLGANIRASARGVVYRARTWGGYGQTVILNHGGGLFTLYGHMITGSFQVSEGQTVNQSQVLGRVGNTGDSTGPHLHFETHEGGYRWYASARNPRIFIPRENARAA